MKCFVRRKSSDGEARERRNDGLFSDDLETVKQALENGADLHCKRMNGCNRCYTPLENACFYGYEDVAEYLIEHRAGIRRLSEEGMTPLQIACEGNQLSIVQLLYQHRADINQTTGFWGTALHIACRQNATKCALFLLEHGAHILKKDGEGNTPLYLAACHTNYKVCDAILARGVPLKMVESVFLEIARYSNNYNSIRYFLRRQDYPLPKSVLNQAFLFAANSKRNTGIMIQALLTAGADLSATAKDGKGALHYAAAKSNVEVAELLIRLGADVDQADAEGKIPLILACENRRVKPQIAELLILKGAALHRQEPYRKALADLLDAYQNREKARILADILWGREAL